MDITGRSYGRLTVMERSHATLKGWMWKCLCVCGNTKIARTDSLTSANTTSCGCYRAERIADANRADLVGSNFGKLTVCGVDSITRSGQVKWRCQCSCGGFRITASAKLLGGRVISCGCKRKAGVALMAASARVAASTHFHNHRARICSAPGRFTATEIKALFAKQEGRCAACAVEISAGEFHRDHIMPLVLGGSNDIGNIQLLCQPCNSAKGSLHPDEWKRRKVFA